ncbi:MAG: CoA transferase [Chloroflexia bacterium]|nr:CoA transferase [Chloroflexia bacterium]
MAESSGALEGVRVIDLTRVMSGPYCTMMLGDMGADVIKVELPGKGDDTRGWGPPFVERPGVPRESAYYLSVNRNKRSIEVDLKSDEGREIFWKLIDSGDVLVENFSPGTMQRLGLGPDEVLARKPELVYCSISGFGQTGPASKRPAYDLIIQGMSGMMSVTGPPDGPTKLGVPIADIAAGMFGAFAIVSALFHQQRSGKGQYIDTSMLGGQVALLSYQAAIYFATREVPPSTWNAHPIVAPYQTFPTHDGFVNIAVGNDGLWAKFTAAMGLEDYRDDPRFKDNEGRITNLAELVEVVEQAFSTRTTAAIVSTLDQAGVPSGPIYTLPEVFTDQQAQHMQMERTMNHPTLGEISTTGFPFAMSDSPASVRLPPPLLGEHTEEILRELGM